MNRTTHYLINEKTIALLPLNNQDYLTKIITLDGIIYCTKGPLEIILDSFLMINLATIEFHITKNLFKNTTVYSVHFKSTKKMSFWVDPMNRRISKKPENE